MVSAAEVRRQRAASDALVKKAQLKVRAGFARLPANPEDARDALLELVPGVVDQYGQTAGTLGADFYDTARSAAQAPGNFRARVVPPSIDAAYSSARRLAGWLFTDDRSGALPGLDAIVDRLVKQSERLTITAAADQETVRFARVPGNAQPCDFCAMLAGRGFKYSSADAAGESWDYHSNCGCQVVPSWDKGSIAGYDPERYNAQYREAVDEGRLDLGQLARSSQISKFENREATNARARNVYHTRRAGGNQAINAGYGYSNPRSMAQALLQGNQRFDPRTGLTGDAAWAARAAS